MPGNAKALRRAWQHSPGASAELEHPPAFAAVEVMVVRLAGNFIASRLAGQRYGIEPAFRQQRFDVAVDRRNAQRLIVTLGRCQRFFRGERAVRFDEGVADGLLLARIAGYWLRHGELMITRFQFLFQWMGFELAACCTKEAPCESSSPVFFSRLVS